MSPINSDRPNTERSGKNLICLRQSSQIAKPMTLTAIYWGITLCLGSTAKRHLKFRRHLIEKQKTKK